MELVDLLKYLYERYPAEIAERSYLYSCPEMMLGFISEDAPEELSLEALDDYSSDLHSNSDVLATLLAEIPPKMVMEEFGEDAMIWAWVNYDCSSSKKLHEEIGELIDVDPSHLEKARSTVFEYIKMKSAELVIRNHDLISNMHMISSFADQLENILKDNSREGTMLSEKRISNYSIETLSSDRLSTRGYDSIWNTTNEVGGFHYPIYLDSPASLALLYKEKPNAVVSMFASDLDTLMINQIQGIQGKQFDDEKNLIKTRSSRGLMPLDWRPALVCLAGIIAKENGFSRLSIQGGENNYWTKVWDENESHLSLEVAHKAYDVLAQRLGFTKEPDKNWYKEL